MKYHVTKNWGSMWADRGRNQEGKTWFIPSDFKKSSDKRFKQYKPKNANPFSRMTSKETER